MSVLADVPMGKARLLPFSPSQPSPSDSGVDVTTPPKPPWPHLIQQPAPNAVFTVPGPPMKDINRAGVEPLPQEMALAGPDPPTKAMWEAFRPMITDLYKRKQHTARQIIEELKQHDFYASEKMLRDRFRAWEINTKNRNSKRQNSIHVSGDGAGRRDAADVARLGGLKMALRTATTELPARRSMMAVSDWYDHILENREKAFSSWEEPCPMFNVTHEFSVALIGLEGTGFKFGWKKLRDIGAHIDHALLSSHSLSLIWLFENMVSWKCKRPEVVNAVRRLWAQRACDILGPRHPMTIIIATICQRAPDELCDYFFATVDSKLPDDEALSEAQLQVASLSQIVYTQVLFAKERFEKLDSTLEKLAIKTSSAPPYAYQHPQVLRMQAHSRKAQGDLRRAEELLCDAHQKLIECDKEFTGVTSIVLIDRAKVKDELGELDECEEILYEALRIQPLCVDSAILQRPMALYHLHEVLGRRGKHEEQALLTKTYPEAFETTGVTERMEE